MPKYIFTRPYQLCLSVLDICVLHYVKDNMFLSVCKQPAPRQLEEFDEIWTCQFKPSISTGASMMEKLKVLVLA